MSETHTSPRLRLYLIRHGEIEPAAMGNLIGQTDVSLSERGVEQARRLAEKLSSVRLDAVYSVEHRIPIVGRHKNCCGHLRRADCIDDAKAVQPRHLDIQQ
jgi:Histidine phosphatase superfamily (branch 1)